MAPGNLPDQVVKRGEPVRFIESRLEVRIDAARDPVHPHQRNLVRALIKPAYGAVEQDVGPRQAAVFP